MSARKRVVVATHNAHKVAEIRAILTRGDWEFVSLDELGISEEPVEDADSFVGNARIKARFAHEKTGLAALADDSGLEVFALDGAPGVYSSRYAGDDANADDNNEKLLLEMQGLVGEDRAAQYACAMVFIDEDGTEVVAEGICEGHIGLVPRGSNGFGYDPLFCLEQYDYARTMAEIPAEEKNAMSHRYAALRRLDGLLSVSEHMDVPLDLQINGRAVQNTEHDKNMEAPVQEKKNQNQSASSEKVQIVAFDFDGTLIDASSPVKLIARLNRDRIMPKRNVAKSVLWGLRYKMGRELDQKKPRRYVFASFKNFSASDANSIMRNLYKEELRPFLRPQAVEALRKHQEEGQEIIVVSASFEPIIDELCKDLGIEHYICTRMEIVDGSYSGETIGDPPESEHKLRQFSKWANECFGVGQWELTYAYGDHFSDVPLIETALHPIAVDPDRRLESIAKDRGWEIHLWEL